MLRRFLQSLLSGQVHGESFELLSVGHSAFWRKMLQIFSSLCWHKPRTEELQSLGGGLAATTCQSVSTGPLALRLPATLRLLSLVALDRIIAWWRWFDGGQAPDLVNEDGGYILRPRVLGATRYRRFVKTSKGYIGLFPRATADGDCIYLLAGDTLPCVLGEDVRRSGSIIVAKWGISDSRVQAEGHT